MHSFTVHPTPEIVFGPGSAASVPSKVNALARPGAMVMLVADPALAPLGITARLVEGLKAQGSQVAIYDTFKGEPKSADIDRAADTAREAKVRAVVGLGGGTALDAAKLVACCAVATQPAEAYQLCAAPLPIDRLPIVCIPTTAGTGSEVTQTSVFTNSRGAKVWAWGPEIKPDLAILDPELTVGLPPAVTAATGLDALVHAIEASSNRRRFPANDLYCHEAIRLIAANLERAVRNGRDLEARGAMLLASCYAGIGIDNCGTAIAHNISHALASLAPLPHGRATAIGLAATLDWVAEEAPQAFAAIAEALGGARDHRAAALLFVRLARASGLKLSLQGDGLDLERPDLLASQMAAPENAPMRQATAREVTDGDLLMLAERVYAFE